MTSQDIKDMTAQQIVVVLSDVGVTNKAIATICGVHRHTVARWIAGTAEPSKLAAEKLRQIAEFFCK